jgi:hypothetical protein
MDKDPDQVMDLASEQPKTKKLDEEALLIIDAEMMLLIEQIQIATQQTGQMSIIDLAAKLDSNAPSVAGWIMQGIIHMWSGTMSVPIDAVLTTSRNIRLDISSEVRARGKQIMQIWSLADLESVVTERQVSELAAHVAGPYCKYRTKAWKTYMMNKFDAPESLLKFKNLESELNLTLSETWQSLKSWLNDIKPFRTAIRENWIPPWDRGPINPNLSKKCGSIKSHDTLRDRLEDEAYLLQKRLDGIKSHISFEVSAHFKASSPYTALLALQGFVDQSIMEIAGLDSSPEYYPSNRLDEVLDSLWFILQDVWDSSKVDNREVQMKNLHGKKLSYERIAQDRHLIVIRYARSVSKYQQMKSMFMASIHRQIEGCSMTWGHGPRTNAAFLFLEENIHQDDSEMVFQFVQDTLKPFHHGSFMMTTDKGVVKISSHGEVIR